ncbi:alpha/beta hydrolase [Couchioplanes caeruleus]|uniref:Alpha/beta hydrolase n=2 Tax=Couchioplanes caeruleus TaxID=56438 RepID=A0A1K0GZ91_9ACTN|nr:alpha/beta fold hydrolase [Couchioplanes caeruleus]OJF14747.1 alpha/beta hydrolase [Couchioplanes caeruleus subsp. caeruleus]ROP29274.1 alpha-beta hydrolase superfamily lysophospholipase [Couchioplanes caeruleus]
MILRFEDWTDPVPPARREVLSALPHPDEGHPPLLFVPSLGHGAWAFREHWLGHAASRGFAAYALSPRENGTLRAYVHDVVQAAAGLPRQAVLIGHGTGARIVAHALARYPARAAVLAAPVLQGWPVLGAALRTNPLGTLPALFGGGLRLRARQLFSAGFAGADAYAARLAPTPAGVCRSLLTGPAPARPAGASPVLVVGSPDDRIVTHGALDRAAARHGGAPLLFPGMGHDLMLDAGWQEPIDAVLDWLVKELSP